MRILSHLTMKKTHQRKKQSKDKNNEDSDLKKDEANPVEDDEFNLSLAKMEEEIKPKIYKF